MNVILAKPPAAQVAPRACLAACRRARSCAAGRIFEVGHPQWPTLPTCRPAGQCQPVAQPQTARVLSSSSSRGDIDVRVRHVTTVWPMSCMRSARVRAWRACTQHNRQGQWQPLAATGQQLNVLRARATSGSQCLRPATALARSTFSVVVVRLARPTERTVSQRNRSFMCLSYSP